ncbi:hypothetical protein A3C94_02550 [Candidatus Kaiserbacteria bacterium RIFCSPHIGHO2_02_FULL_55_17]|uniref:GST N-terminal domain-containing protein n=1 Tax=Candidatus Kaiserbacteria bacterium RIFCSPHIGHO2_02_FULL_55_17 TaxID=1798496 RepID=A0A1F6DSX5_9BACT|nr:MAG: hypothetical protein A3C94_02550 [Candidatus Kaiserbacteria bacterium RIFCSPHIGHO2_02_FULL_55_17]
MLTLYRRTGCPYCLNVLDTARELGLELKEKFIDDPKNAVELVARGGKRQVPYLVDSGRGVEMYESEDIRAYLREHYPKR